MFKKPPYVVSGTPGTPDAVHISFRYIGRDIDGDGFIEDVVTGAEDIVDDAVTGAEDILDDILPGEHGGGAPAIHVLVGEFPGEQPGSAPVFEGGEPSPWRRVIQSVREADTLAAEWQLPREWERRVGPETSRGRAHPKSAFLWGSTPFLWARPKKWGGIGSTRQSHAAAKRRVPPTPPAPRLLIRAAPQPAAPYSPPQCRGSRPARRSIRGPSRVCSCENVS